MKYLISFIVLVFSTQLASAQDMNNKKLGELLTKQADSIIGQEGNWRFSVKETLFICLTDEKNNRMRIISPIIEIEKLNEELMENCLTANFHTALDVKYAISDGVLWSVFIHPLKELSDSQVSDAVIQVYNANITFGTIYSSTDLSFPGALQNKKEETKKKPLPKRKI